LRKDVYNAKIMAKKNIKFPLFKHSLEERGLMTLRANSPGKRGKGAPTRKGFLSCTTSKLTKLNVSDVERQKQWKEQWEELSQICVEFKVSIFTESTPISYD
jgi:hypothetical protein